MVDIVVSRIVIKMRWILLMESAVPSQMSSNKRTSWSNAVSENLLPKADSRWLVWNKSNHGLGFTFTAAGSWSRRSPATICYCYWIFVVVFGETGCCWLYHRCSMNNDTDRHFLPKQKNAKGHSVLDKLLNRLLTQTWRITLMVTRGDDAYSRYCQ